MYSSSIRRRQEPSLPLAYITMAQRSRSDCVCTSLWELGFPASSQPSKKRVCSRQSPEQVPFTRAILVPELSTQLPAWALAWVSYPLRPCPSKGIPIGSAFIPVFSQSPPAARGTGARGFR